MDSIASAASILIPLITGPLVQAAGLPSTGFLAIALMAVPILLAMTLRESPEPAHARPAPSSFLDTIEASKHGD
jgi:hypothetical protein